MDVNGVKANRVNPMQMKANQFSVEQTIYVVGYPKSGNTWLVRLLADALNIPVKSEGMKGALEIASGVNASLNPSDDVSLALMKMHNMPQDLVSEIDGLPKRCVYIYRDFRDVVLSAFFYFKRRAAEKADFRYRRLSSLVKQDPRSLAQYLLCRRSFARFVRAWCDERNEAKLPAQATWKQHVEAWRGFLQAETHCASSTISYERLLADPLDGLRRLIQNLQLPMPNEERLSQAVERQSFGALKRQMESVSGPSDLPFGKDFNLKFLRKGTHGDWLNYISRKIGRTIHDYHGALLTELGYTRDDDWYEFLEPNAA